MITARAWLELARISNLPTVWTNVLAGWLLAGGRWEWPPLMWLLAGGSLLYTAGMILNDAADAQWDREHRPERPIPSGRVGLVTVWSVGVVMMLAGFGMCVWGAGTNLWLTAALVAAILAYDLYHKPWTGSVLIMGACRTLLYLVAGSAVPGGLNWGAGRDLVVKAVALGGYIVGVSIAARAESRKDSDGPKLATLGEGALWLPFAAMVSSGKFDFTAALPDQLSLMAIVLLVFALVCLRGPDSRTGRFGCSDLFGWAFLLVLLLALLEGAWPIQRNFVPLVAFCAPVGFGALFMCVTAASMKLMRSPPPSNIGVAVGRFLAGIVVVDALAVSSISPLTSLIFAASMPLLLLWQRKIAAT